MNITGKVTAGSLESSDVMISLEPGEEGLEIIVDSLVEKQFGRRIRNVTLEILEREGISGGVVRIQDRGALECTLRARIETAVERLSG